MKWSDHPVAHLRKVAIAYKKELAIGAVSKMSKSDLIVLLDKHLTLGEDGKISIKFTKQKPLAVTIGKPKKETYEEIEIPYYHKNRLSSMNDPEIWKKEKAKDKMEYLKSVYGSSKKVELAIMKEMKPHLKKAYELFLKSKEEPKKEEMKVMEREERKEEKEKKDVEQIVKVMKKRR
jgi:hypothetical protein